MNECLAVKRSGQGLNALQKLLSSHAKKQAIHVTGMCVDKEFVSIVSTLSSSSLSLLVFLHLYWPIYLGYCPALSSLIQWICHSHVTIASTDDHHIASPEIKMVLQYVLKPLNRCFRRWSPSIVTGWARILRMRPNKASFMVSFAASSKASSQPRIRLDAKTIEACNNHSQYLTSTNKSSNSP